ncbi:MAG TPA: hypothetical protein VIV58_33450, partial [Kofleriaceae bacterium]
QRSYKLLRWMTDAIDRGFISFGAAHDFAALPAATHVWLDRHYAVLPLAARPLREDLRAFSNLFATYLTSSFELLRNPGVRRLSEDECGCSACTWLVAIPRLKPKTLRPQDRRRGHALQVRAIKELALARDLIASEEAAEAMLAERRYREAAGLVAYARELEHRLDGVTVGPATLALWRSFAWDETGAPKPRFVLTAKMVLAGESALVAALAR